jgi:hypothetical protein
VEFRFRLRVDGAYVGALKFRFPLIESIEAAFLIEALSLIEANLWMVRKKETPYTSLGRTSPYDTHTVLFMRALLILKIRCVRVCLLCLF